MEQVTQTYLERNSFRSTARLFKVSHTTVQNWLKKARALADFKTSILPATPAAVIEVDEVFTFIRLKVKQIRIWIAQCRQTRQILSFFIGDGSMASCKRLWRKLPHAYLRSTSFSDFWKSYNCIPAITHQKVDKKKW